MIAADRQHRHAKFPHLREQGLVLLGIFREGGKLPAERVVNRAWSRVERCIVAARLLVDAGGIGGEFVIEAVEQDSLAPGNEPLDVGAAKVEMPDSGGSGAACSQVPSPGNGASITAHLVHAVQGTAPRAHNPPCCRCHASPARCVNPSSSRMPRCREPDSPSRIRLLDATTIPCREDRGR